MQASGTLFSKSLLPLPSLCLNCTAQGTFDKPGLSYSLPGLSSEIFEIETGHLLTEQLSIQAHLYHQKCLSDFVSLFAIQKPSHSMFQLQLLQLHWQVFFLSAGPDSSRTSPITSSSSAKLVTSRTSTLSPVCSK